MTNPTVLKVPQWQGSSSPTAHRLAEGADRLSALIPAGDLLSPHTTDRPGSTRHGVHHLAVADLADPSLLLQTITETAADTVYVHLDPETFASVGCPEPDGLTPDRLSAAISALAGRFRVAGFGITEYEPSRPADEATLAALIPALTGALLDRG
ncbi:arginase family protein [Nonomuraea sp. NPDC046570]|uniref:arginase family protein n=1 Tax=Nonomuraea sp. NPDC046570 TaxID=3155255 RepID=UPI0033C21BE4